MQHHYPLLVKVSDILAKRWTNCRNNNYSTQNSPIGAVEAKDSCRDLYPVTSVKRFSSPARSISLKEPPTHQPRFPQTNPAYSPANSFSSPNYNIVQRDSPKLEKDSGNETPQQGHLVVVAIDFGTTYSGYAYSFTNDPENISIMRKWEGLNN